MLCPDTGSFHELTNQLYLDLTNRHRKTGCIFPGHPEFFLGSSTNFAQLD